MNINKLTAINFGKLKDAVLELKEGLNVIAAPNEWGKSTWAAFIEAMLYGIDTTQRSKQGALAFKQKYAPVSGSEMAGFMVYTLDNGQAYTVERSQKGKNPLSNVRITLADTGSEISLSGEIGEEIFGIGRHGFKQTYFASQLNVKTESCGEVEKKLHNMYSTGQEEISYSDILKSLEDLRRPLLNRQGGRLGRLEEERARLETARDEAKDDLDRLEVLRAELQRRQAEYGEALSRHNAAIIKKAHEKYSKILSIFREKEERERRCEYYKRQLGNINNEDLERLEGVLGEIANLESRINENLVVLRMKERELSSIEAMGIQNLQTISREMDNLSKRSSSGLAASLIFAIISASCFAAMYFAPVLNTVKLILMASGAASALIFIIALIVSLSRGKTKENERKKQLAKYRTEYDELTAAKARSSVLNEDIVRIKLLKDGQTKQFEEKNNEALMLMEKLGIDRSSPKRSLDSKKMIYSEYVTSLSLLNAAKAAYEAACAGEDVEKIKALASEYTEDMNEMGEGDNNLDALSNEVSRLKDTKAKLEGNLSGRGRIDEISGRIMEIDRERERIKSHVRAIDMAFKALGAAYEEISTRFSPAFSSKVSEILSELTRGTYDKIRISRDMDADVGRAESLFVDSQYMSAGTFDQIYLAMRLALCDIADIQNAPPLILDDTLTNFDDERAKAAMEFLSKYSKRRQVILFTCHSRIAEYAKITENAHLISYI